MIQVKDNRIIADEKILQFNTKIMEAVECCGTVIVVFETDEDGGYDNVFCYTLDSKLLWRIKPAPIEIGGTARSPYVGVDILNGKCRVVDFFGRRFEVDVKNGEILSKDIVR